VTSSNLDNQKNLIVVGRDVPSRRMFVNALQRTGYVVVEHTHAGDVMGSMNNSIMAIVVDVSADVDRGSATVQRLANIDVDVPVVAVSTNADAWQSVVNVGGYACVTGPREPDRVVSVVDRAVAQRGLLLRIANLERKYRNLQNAVQDAMDDPPADLEQQFGEGTDVHDTPSDGAGAEVVPLRVLEERAIKHAMQVTNGSVTKAARLLGIGRATLYRRLANNPAN